MVYLVTEETRLWGEDGGMAGSMVVCGEDTICVCLKAV